MQSALIDVIIDTHHGKINPLLLTPKQLQEQLNIIKDYLPTTLHLPTYNNNLLELYNLMSVESRITAETIIFRLTLPLLSHERFQLLSITTVPAIINRTFITLEPSSNLMIVDLHRDLHYSLSYQEFMACKMAQKSVYYCIQHHPLYKRNVNRMSCELSVLIQSPIPENCRVTTSAYSPRYIQLNTPNQWIYTVADSTTINVLCNGTVAQQELNGTGILTLPQGCSITDESLAIHSHDVYTTTVNSAIIPSKNFIELLQPLHWEKLAYRPTAVINVTEEITNIKDKIQALKQAEEHQPVTNNYEIHHLSISYLALISVIILIRYLVLQRLRYNTKPTPAPRIIHGDFRIDPTLILNSKTVQGEGECSTQV